MSTLEIMRKVKQSEGEADEIRRAAAAEAREIVRAVEGSSALNERQAAQELRERVTAFHREEDQKTESKVERILADEREAQGTQREAAKLRVAGAADLIYERILKHGNR